MTPSSPACSASTAKATNSAMSGAGRRVWFSVKMSSSLGVTLVSCQSPAGSGRPDPDRKLPQAVGEVRPDAARWPGELEGGDAPGQCRQYDPDLKPGQVGAEAQVRAATAEAEVPGRGPGDVDGVGV